MSKEPGLSGLSDCLWVRQVCCSPSFFPAALQYSGKQFCLVQVSLQSPCVCACPSSSSPPAFPLPVRSSLPVAFLSQVSWSWAALRAWEAGWPGREERGPLAALHNRDNHS